LSVKSTCGVLVSSPPLEAGSILTIARFPLQRESTRLRIQVPPLPQPSFFPLRELIGFDFSLGLLSVTVKQLLSGSVDPPPFADALINKLISCTERLPSGRQWIPDDRDHSGSGRSSPAPDVNEFGAPSSPYGGSGGGEDFSQQPPAQYGFVGMGSTCGKDKDGRSRSGSGGRLGMGGRTRSGSILSEGNLGMGPRTRSGSILGNGNGRKRGDSVSKVVEQDVTGGSGGRGGSPKPSSSPKPGLFSNVSFTGRKRGNSYSKGGADASGHYSTSEGYNADAPVKPIHPRAQAYLAEVFPLQPEGAPTLSSSPSNSNSVTPFSTVPTPPPSTRRVSSVATPTFATHFESDFAHDESDLLSSSPPQADPDLIAWDDSRQKTRPRGNSSPLNPSSFDEDRNRDYRNPNSSSRYDDELYPSSESMAIPRPAFSSSASSGSGSFSRFMSSSPSNSNSATNGKKKSRPFSAFVRSGSFVNTPSSPNHSPSTPTGGYGNDDYFGSRPSPPPPSHREDLKAEEDWGALGTKARIGLGRTRSGSGSQLLNSTTASDLLHDVPDEDGQVEGTGGGWGNESREDEVHSRMEKMRIVPKKGLDLDKAELKRMGFVGRGIALFDFKTEQVRRLLSLCRLSSTTDD
jgi:hypothetical protein